MNEPGYTSMNIAAVAAMSAELDRMKASHQALIDALEKIELRATGDGQGSTLDEMSLDFYRIRETAKAALKLAKGEA